MTDQGGPLLTTPTASQYGSNRSVSPGAAVRPSMTSMVAGGVDLQQYGPAVRRQEEVTWLPAPSPVEQGPKGRPRLSAAFTEWMMGLPAGWITAVPGMSWTGAVRMAGNGVVPAQAVAALADMLGEVG